MSWTRPTLTELVNSQISEIEARLPGAESRLRSSVLNVLARVVAGGLHLFYGFLAWMARQLFVDTAEADFLSRHAAIWLKDGRKAATLATGFARFTGAAGVSVPAGTALTRSDAAEFVTTAAGVIGTGGYVDIAVAATDVGSSGNCDAGLQFSITTPISSVVSTAVVQSPGITGGNDVEADDDLRARVLSRIQDPPQGGATGDYVNWALEVAGVTRAWELPAYFGLGTVGLLFVRDTDASMIPDATEVAAVQTYVDTLRPVTADLTVLAPIAQPVAYQIRLTPATAAVKAAVVAALQDLHARESVPGTTFLRSHIDDAISQATGETDHLLVSPAADVVNGPIQMATYGSVTWL